MVKQGGHIHIFYDTAKKRRLLERIKDVMERKRVPKYPAKLGKARVKRIVIKKPKKKAAARN